MLSGARQQHRVHPAWLLLPSILGVGIPFFLLTLAVGLPSTVAQPAFVVVAVMPFTDEVGFHEDLASWAAARLTVLLSRNGVRVVPFARVQSALHQLGRRTSPPVTLAAAEDLAHLLQAEAVITGRLTQADRDWESDDRVGQMGPPEFTVTFSLRLMIVGTRRIFHDEVTGFKTGGPDGLTRAAEKALEEYVSRLPQGELR